MSPSTAVVCAAFDAATEERIEHWRSEAAAAGLRVRRAHRPHVTLAAARVDEPGEVVTLAGGLAARHQPVPLVLTGLDTFPRGVLWLRPAPSPALAGLQRDAHDSLRAAGWAPAFGPRSAPERWIAHCTLVTGAEADALDRLLRRDFEPIPARVEALAVLLVGGRGDVAHLPLTG